MTEHERLFDIYLRHSGIFYRENPQMIIPSTKLWEVVRSLKPLDAPDMYAKIGDKVYILEHFSFDASKETSKGMAGQREEQKLEARISRNNVINEWQMDSAQYSQTLYDFEANFNRHFDSHYNRIEQYKKNLIDASIAVDTDDFVVGFWIENQYPPYCLLKNTKQSLHSGKGFTSLELCYIATTQFNARLKNADHLDFVFFSGIFHQKNVTYYIDKKSLLSDEEQIDLHDPDLVLLKLNEVTAFSNYSIEEDCDNA